MALTKADLIELLFERLGLNKREAKVMVEGFFEEIRAALERGKGVKLSGFGNFQLRDKPQRPGRNPKTGEVASISAHRVVTFHPSQKLKGIDWFSPTPKAYSILIKDFVRFALKKKWQLPKEFPYKAEIMANENVECVICHYGTNLLKIQAAAIKKFWANFDRLRPGTEPKSAVVIDWLMAEYRVSRNVASVMASIIRPDGLKHGVKTQKKNCSMIAPKHPETAHVSGLFLHPAAFSIA
jgi:integration host factor subunit alpha